MPRGMSVCDVFMRCLVLSCVCNVHNNIKCACVCVRARVRACTYACVRVHVCVCACVRARVHARVQTLVKHYDMKIEVNEDSPLNFDGPQIVGCKG